MDGFVVSRFCASVNYAVIVHSIRGGANGRNYAKMPNAGGEFTQQTGSLGLDGGD